ncbi:hypothetical protein ISCGN_005152 [Ixodes scapularis]
MDGCWRGRPGDRRDDIDRRQHRDRAGSFAVTRSATNVVDAASAATSRMEDEVDDARLRWPPPLHSEPMPSDADSGYEPSPAFFTSGRAAFVFDWPQEEEANAEDTVVIVGDDTPPSSSSPPQRSSAIPIPRRSSPDWRSPWPEAVDATTQTSPRRSLPLSPTPFESDAGPGSLLLRLLEEATIPDLVPRVEERFQRASTRRLSWALVGVQLRNISDSFALSRSAPTGRRCGLGLTLRSD